MQAARLLAKVGGRAVSRFRLRQTRRILPDRHGYILVRDVRGIVVMYWAGPSRDSDNHFSRRRSDAYTLRHREAAESATRGRPCLADCQVLRVRL